jgi:DnaJ-class molecular chaperone
MRISEARKILGVEASAGQDEIKAAYRKLAMKHHPDRGGDEAQFVKVKQAYEALEKSNFSTEDFESFGPFQFTSGMNFGDAFNPFSRAQQVVRQVAIKLPIQEVYYGASRTVNMGGRMCSVTIPAGVGPEDIIHREEINGQIWELSVRVESEYKVDWDQPDRGNVKVDFYVSPFRMILGGWAEAKMLDGSSVSVRIPPGLEANKFLKVQGKGYWKNKKCHERGDCLLRVIPAIQKLGDIPVEHMKEFIDEYAKYINPSV